MPSSSSWANTLQIVESDVETYNFMALFLMGGNTIGGIDKYLFISSKACWCSDAHLKPSFLYNRNNHENTFILPLTFEMNLLIKFIFPNKDCSCLLLVGDLVFCMDFVLFEFIFMPFLWATKPRKSHAWTQKAHFNGFILSPYFLILFNDRRRWSRWPSLDEDLMTMSSM